MLVVGHLQLHTGQIILLTKQLAGVDLDLSIPRKRVGRRGESAAFQWRGEPFANLLSPPLHFFHRDVLRGPHDQVQIESNARKVARNSSSRGLNV